MVGDHPIDHHHEGPRRAADLVAAAAKGRDEKTRDHGGEQALAGRGARGDGQGHGQGQGDNGHGQPGHGVSLEVGQAVALSQHAQQLGFEAAARAGDGQDSLGHGFIFDVDQIVLH